MRHDRRVDVVETELAERELVQHDGELRTEPFALLVARSDHERELARAVAEVAQIRVARELIVAEQQELTRTLFVHVVVMLDDLGRRDRLGVPHERRVRRIVVSDRELGRVARELPRIRFDRGEPSRGGRPLDVKLHGVHPDGAYPVPNLVATWYRLPDMIVLAGAALSCLLLLGCGDHGSLAIDAATPDTVRPELQPCAAPSGTASVTVDDHGTVATVTRLHAGGTWFIGPVAPVASPAMSVVLLFTNADQVPADTARCCAAAVSSCCPIDGVVVTNDGLASGGEPGAHTVMLKSFQNASFSIAGTMTITGFVQPFEHAPGRIAGLVSASIAGQSVSGSFDHSFCAALLSETI